MAYDNSPGCGEAAIKDASECGLAAESLGYRREVTTLPNFGNLPPGCQVSSIDGTMFNTYTGTDGTGNTKSKSVCHKAGILDLPVFRPTGPLLSQFLLLLLLLLLFYQLQIRQQP